MSTPRAVQDPAGSPPAWLNSLSTPLLLIDAQSRVCALNAACEDLLGLSLVQWQELMPQTATSQAAVLSPEQAALSILSWLPGAQSLHLTVRLPDARGLRAVQVQAAGPAIDDAGMRCVQLSDNTGLVQALGSAELHDKRFEQLFRNAPMGVVLLELESGIVRQANESFAAMIGRRQDQVIGQAWRVWTHPDDVAESVHEIERLSMGDSQLAIVDKRYLKLDGEVVWVHVTMSPIEVAGGQPPLILKTVEDISQRKAQQEVLERTQARLRKAERVGKMALWEWSPAAKRLHVSAKLDQLFGLNQDDPAWWRQVVHPEDLPRIDQALAEALHTQSAFTCQFRLAMPNGKTRWFEAQGEPDARLTAGEQRLTGLCRDITSDKQAEDELRASEERFRKLFEDTRQPTMLVEEGKFIAVNKACVELFGYQREEQMLGLTPVDCSPPQQPDGRPSAEKAMEVIGQAFQAGSARVEWQCVRPSGELFFIELLLTTIEQDGRILLHAAFQDVTEARNNRVRLSYLAYNDPLTGLSNWVQGQSILNTAVAQAYSQQTQAAVVALGLDKFKLINDLHGHAVGDAILRQAAQRLRKVLRSGDSLCRLSGDEFMLVMTSVQSDRQIQVVFERLQAQFSEPFNVDEFRLSVSVSAGAAVLDVVAGPQDDGVEDASERLLRHADTALSEAKQKGPGSMCLFEASMNARLVHFVQTRDDLRQAMRLDQFELHYQPQVHAQSAQVRGVEALLRWRHPQHGLLTPGDFIQVAEDTGLIVPIGSWVLRQACEQAQIWRAAGWLDVVVSVNVSGLQFTQGDLDKDVADALRQSGLPASNLELELTESMLLQNSQQVLEQVARWHAQGIQLAIDDFGTGYSSLSYLHQFRVEHLKIDRSFVVNMLHSERDLALVRAIMQLAQGLQLSTIAEGVETQAQAELLSQLGCDLMQGYLYAKPLPADELVQWLGQRQPGLLM